MGHDVSLPTEPSHVQAVSQEEGGLGGAIGPPETCNAATVQEYGFRSVLSGDPLEIVETAAAPFPSVPDSWSEMPKGVAGLDHAPERAASKAWWKARQEIANTVFSPGTHFLKEAPHTHTHLSGRFLT